MAITRAIFGPALCLFAAAASTSAATVPSWSGDFPNFENSAGCCRLADYDSNFVTNHGKIKVPKANAAINLADAFNPSSSYSTDCMAKCDTDNGCVGANLKAHTWKNSKTGKTQVTAYSCVTYNTSAVVHVNLKGSLCKTSQCLRVVPATSTPTAMFCIGCL